MNTKDLDFKADKGNQPPTISLSLSLALCNGYFLIIFNLYFTVLAKEFLSNFADANGEAKYMNILVSLPLFSFSLPKCESKFENPRSPFACYGSEVNKPTLNFHS